jgi:hypothetical protein
VVVGGTISQRKKSRRKRCYVQNVKKMIQILLTKLAKEDVIFAIDVGKNFMSIQRKEKENVYLV